MYAFLHLPRTAGSTLRFVLYSTFGLGHANVEPWHYPDTYDPHWLRPFAPQDLRRVKQIHPRLRSIAGHLIKAYAGLEAVEPDIKYFTFLRDPLSHAVSLYRFSVFRGWSANMTFEEYLRLDQIGNRQTVMLCGEPDAQKTIQLIREKNIFVGLVEHFDESLLLLKSLLIPELNAGYTRRNMLSTKAVPRNVADEAHIKDLLIDVNQADLELYDYVKRELFPSYRQAYGTGLADTLVQHNLGQQGFNQRNVILTRMYRILVGKPVRRGYMRLHGIPDN